MAADLYLRLYALLNAPRFDSPEVQELVARLGPTALVIRGLAGARRHAWTRAREDLRAAVAAPNVAPVVELVAAVGLFVAREYDLAVATLARAGQRGKPGVASLAHTYSREFTAALGWTPELEHATTPLDLAIAGELPGAHAALAQPTCDLDDPRLLYLRGRALLDLGEPTKAADLLERARVKLPESVAIGLALALARHHEAPTDRSDALAQRFVHSLERAPALLSDAAAELGLGVWTDRGLLDSRTDKVAILTRAQQLLLTHDAQGEPVWYRKHGGVVGQVPLTRPGEPKPLTRLHADDRARIDRVDALLVKALGVKPPRPERMGSPQPTGGSRRFTAWQPQALSAAQIEQFLDDGYIVIPQAFDPAISKRWREDANRRIRDEPERWVRDYDPHDPRKSLRRYSPDDPSTWTWPRIDLIGAETVRIDEFAPHAWTIICDLLGGPDRIKTRTWNNYLILNLCADAELGVDVPGPGWKSWHIDDPSPVTRIDRIANGLVGITLHDRVLPGSGNTWLAPQSVALVARELAEHPSGVDFVRQRGGSITTQCQRFDEVVGEAGDLLLLHPLLMHSASPNRSGRIRWIGNPMVYLHEPLDPFRPLAELSPVERAIRRAIDQ